MRILVAEDEPVSRHRLHATLVAWGYEVASVSDGAQALHALAQPDAPSLVILDWTMPEVDGLQVCRAIRDTRGCADPYVYAILLTANDRDEDVIQGFAAGADDYVTKPFDANELKARVRTGARIIELQRQLITAREQLREKAMHDALTGLLNRGAFYETFEQEVSRARRQQTPLTLMIADLDHFKRINDRYGHVAGDEVLRETARRLRSAVRVTDAVGRYGGEEFVGLGVDCGLDEGLKMAERFRRAVSAAPIHTPSGAIELTTSVGVAAVADMNDAIQVFKDADDALYRAKFGGRNRIEGGVRAA
jgi:diguanylate cyclase (GGDEF)-like protein